MPKSTLSTKFSSCFPASSTAELINYCTLLDSASVLSERIEKSSLNLTKQKNDSRKVNLSSSGYTISNPSKIVAKGKNQAGNSKLSTFLKSSTKLSSSISPASSISVQSSEALSSTSAANQRSNIVRESLGIGSHKGLTTNCDDPQDLDSPNHPKGQCLLGAGAEVTGALDERLNKVSEETSGLLHPAPVKPSGLKLPSPKIGFFDGVSYFLKFPSLTVVKNKQTEIFISESSAGKVIDPVCVYSLTKSKWTNCLLVFFLAQFCFDHECR